MTMTDNSKNSELELLLQQPLPRKVPEKIKHSILVRISLGLFIAIFSGVFALLVGGPRDGVIFQNKIFTEFRLDLGRTALAMGNVTDCKYTEFNINGGHVNEIDYSFIAQDQKQYLGYSYNLGNEVIPKTKTEIEYLVEDPSVSRINNLRIKVFSSLGMTFIITPICGFIFIFGGIINFQKSWKKYNRLVAFGELTQGRIESISPPHKQRGLFSGRTITVGYYYNGLRMVKFDIYGKVANLYFQWKENNRQMHVLFDPNKPKDSLVLEDFLKIYN